MPNTLDNVSSLANACEDSQLSRSFAAVSVPVIASISLLSVLLNCFNIAVFSQRKMVTPTNSILLGIAISDLSKVLIFLAVAVIGARWERAASSYGWQATLLVCNVVMYLMHAFALWCGVLLALFRFFYLQFYAAPGTKVWFGLARARLALVLAFLANASALAPYAANLRVEAASSSNALNDSEIAYQVAIEPQHAFKIRLFNCLAQKALPCLLMAGLCCCIIRCLRRTERRRESLAKQKSASARHERRSRHHRRTTAFLMVIIVLYIVYEIPVSMLNILEDEALGLPGVQCFMRSYAPLLNTLALVNNSVNFVLYCCMSKQFRQAFNATFGLHRLLLRKRDGQESARTERQRLQPGSSRLGDREGSHLDGDNRVDEAGVNSTVQRSPAAPQSAALSLATWRGGLTGRQRHNTDGGSDAGSHSFCGSASDAPSNPCLEF